MARKSKGRGTAAAFGLLLLVAGLVGGGFLYMESVRRPSDRVDDFARAPVGCTTTLRFTETGTFYVFEDVSVALEVPEGGCEPSADPTQTFAFELTGPNGPVVPRAAGDVSYDNDDHVGTSVARVEISRIGEYEIVVVGDDAGVVAAIGRDPDDGVEELRRRSIIVAAVGIVVGGLLLLLAGRRSKHAATFRSPDGPGWGPEQAPRPRVLPLDEAHASRQPVNPHQPEQEVAIAGPLSEVNDLLAQPPPPPLPRRQPAWAPPAEGAPVESARDESTADGAPVDESPVESVLDETTADETPEDESPVDETPGDETPGDETPGDETPGDETPGDETPGDETPGDEVARAASPADETPGEDLGDAAALGVGTDATAVVESAGIEDAGGDDDRDVPGGPDDGGDAVIDVGEGPDDGGDAVIDAGEGPERSSD